MARIGAMEILCICLSISFIPITCGGGASAKDAAVVVVVKRDARHIINQILRNSLLTGTSAMSTRSKRSLLHLRYKRSLETKELEDPNNCIHACWDKEDAIADDILTKFESKIHASDAASDAEDPAASAKLQDSIMNNMGSLLSDSCQGSKKTKSCISACPNSKLKDVALGECIEDQTACEPEQNFGGYTSYRAATNCVNFTMAVSHEECEKKCGGKYQSLRDATQFGLDKNESESSTVYYEKNADQNYNTVKEQCKKTTCHRDCTKPYLVKRCQKNVYDFYVRQLKVEPKSALNILQKLDALKNVPPECNDLK